MKKVILFWLKLIIINLLVLLLLLVGLEFISRVRDKMLLFDTKKQNKKIKLYNNELEIQKKYIKIKLSLHWFQACFIVIHLFL